VRLRKALVETKMSTLKRALEIAKEVHQGVFDKAGAPYINHPMRVMESLATVEEKIVGVLHDVVEDGAEWTFDRIRREGFSEAIVEALDSVTKRPEDEDQSGDDQATKVARYIRFVSRAARHPIGRRVKLADLRDNLDSSRIAEPTDKDLARMAKYEIALRFLELQGD